MRSLENIGFRVLGFAKGPDHAAVLQTRAGRNISSDFPAIARAVATSLPAGTVVDGELCAWRDGRLAFEDLLRTRAARGQQQTAIGSCGYQNVRNGPAVAEPRTAFGFVVSSFPSTILGARPANLNST